MPKQRCLHPDLCVGPALLTRHTASTSDESCINLYAVQRQGMSGFCSRERTVPSVACLPGQRGL